MVGMIGSALYGHYNPDLKTAKVRLQRWATEGSWGLTVSEVWAADYDRSEFIAVVEGRAFTRHLAGKQQVDGIDFERMFGRDGSLVVVPCERPDLYVIALRLGRSSLSPDDVGRLTRRIAEQMAAEGLPTASKPKP